MPKIRLNNTSDKTLVVFVEPWAEEYWMRPRESFTIEFDASDAAEHVIGDTDFEMSWHDQGVIVWTASAIEVVVRDQSGTRLEGGHHRPPTD
ncbi:hypothetical protein ACIA8C_37220 [Nocardia sp. NPDC051321]|uniref:hypothetical protein n=1 Tax=Nocardia sp. NPDC051321 TaxID=3364323 RepID=UPI00378CC753